MPLPRALLGIGLLLCLAASSYAEGETSGLWIRPIPPCLLLDTSATGRLDLGQPWPLFLGDSEHGKACSQTATAADAPSTSGPRVLVVRAEVSNAQGAGRLLAGSPGHDLVPIFTFGQGTDGAVLPFALVELCQTSKKEPCTEGDLLIAAEGAAADIKLEAIGLLEPPAAITSQGTEDHADAGAGEQINQRSSTAPYWDLNLTTGSLSYTEGFVGIGTATPEAEFHVDAEHEGMIVSQPAYFDYETVSNYFEPRYPALFLRRNSGTRGSTLALGNNSGRMYLYGSPGGFKIYDSTETQRFFLDDEGHLGLGQLSNDPAYTLHIGGDLVVRDPTDGMNVFEILPKSTSVNGYAGGNVFTNTRMLRLLTPYQNSTGTITRGNLVFGSPEVWGAENAYVYGFNNKNIRIGVANDGYRRAEIEIYNNNTSEGRILFRTGLWQDPGNTSASSAGVRMLIDNSGNVGIGTTLPSEKLEIQGNLKLSGSILSAGDICIGSCV